MEDRVSPSQVDDPWEDLAISMLAVNQYSIEKTYPLVEGLRQVGLTDPRNLGLWEPGEIVLRLKAAGCDRGDFMNNLFSVRLSSLGVAVRQQGIEAFEQVFLEKDPATIDGLLLPINGIGPKVLRNFSLLRGIK